MTADFQTDLALLLAYLERQYLPPVERDALRRIKAAIERVHHPPPPFPQNRIMREGKIPQRKDDA